MNKIRRDAQLNTRPNAWNGGILHFSPHHAEQGYLDVLSRLEQEFPECFSLIGAGVARPRGRCVSLVPTDSLATRQQAVDRFQQDADCRIFIGPTSAAGTGNNLTVAN